MRHPGLEPPAYEATLPGDGNSGARTECRHCGYGPAAHMGARTVCNEPFSDPHGCNNLGCPAAHWRSSAEAVLMRQREAERLARDLEWEKLAAIRNRCFSGGN